MNTSKLLLLLGLNFLFLNINAQKHKRDSAYSQTFEKFSPDKLIIPGVLFGYGLLSYNNPTGIKINKQLNKDIAGDNPVKVDDFTAFIPGVSVLLIDLVSHNAKHDLKDRSIILLTSSLLTNGTTFALKSLTNEKRPMENKYNSFPSGHTANAFAGAEFLRLEYKDASIWYPIVGYSMAVATAYLRMYNNKHWFSDVVAGAGIGILSTNIAYWIYPWMQRTFSGHKNKAVNAMVIPSYDGKNTQLGMILRF